MFVPLLKGSIERAVLTPVDAFGTKQTSSAEAPMNSANSLLLLILLSVHLSVPLRQSPSPRNWPVMSLTYSSITARVEAGHAPMTAVSK